jgi:protein-glutamine gamma-glutamyltransferase
MIYINTRPADLDKIKSALPDGSIQEEALDKLAASPQRFDYSSEEELLFELDMREAIVLSSVELYKGGLNFAIFRKSRCNPKYWNRTSEGGFRLRRGVSPYEAIMDIFENSGMYATECATAMVIVYYGALAKLYGKEVFDRTFKDIYLMDWHNIDPLLRDIGYMSKPAVYLPGDRRYFANPDVDPETPEWQGENVIDLSDGNYYGHGIGIGRAGDIIEALNQNRAPGSTRSAYLMDTVGRPNFKRLYQIAAGR